MVRSLVVLCLLSLGVGCAPRLAPPYRDYRVGAGAETDLSSRITEAATEVGWDIVAPSASDVITTAPRSFDDGLTSDTEAVLDLVPLGGGVVRVYVRAERRTLLGGRTKVYALSSGLRRAVLGPLTESLAARGLTALDAPRDRDEEAVE